ncbi:MAG: DUF433 domain-containing protein [Candidatus Aquicultorales bacterium]
MVESARARYNNREVLEMKKIIIDQGIMHGQPVIEGTRVLVSVVLGSLAEGMTQEEIQHEYDLTEEDIRAALKYAAELVSEEQVIPLKKTS